MNRRRLACLVIIAGFIAYSVSAFQAAVTPYVTFAQAKGSKAVVQVKGTLAGPQILPAGDGQAIRFVLRDDAGEEASVIYRGMRPASLEQATAIVAIGQYRGSEFQADKLLVKCPSKYQGSVNK